MSDEAAVQPVTELLLAWSRGEAGALERLTPLVYAELRRRARGPMFREGSGHTLQPTALVNEVYLRLVDQQRASFRNRAQFFGIAAQMMRRVLVDHARRRRAGKRGAGLRVELDAQNEPAASVPDADLEALDAALERLATLDPRQGRIVELRYFGGLSIEETAGLLEISAATVKREWTVARAWLYGQLRA